MAIESKVEAMEAMYQATQDDIITSEVELINLKRTLPVFDEKKQSVIAHAATLKGKDKYKYEKLVVDGYENHHKKLAIATANKEAALDSKKMSLKILGEMIEEEKSKETKE